MFKNILDASVPALIVHDATKRCRRMQRRKPDPGSR
jgi:hypothetical protein